MSDQPKPDDANDNPHPPHAWLPEVHFGTAITPLPEETAAAEASNGDDDEDEEEATPPDVIWMLGFDPADEADDDAEGDEDADD